ncbi:hypothetical protein ACP275_03G054300 [Erythranthe tilingii]
MDPTTTPIPQPESGGRLFSGTAELPPEAEHPPCPRCDSTDTKFCYYNNYNLSQPRHFCKSCRRYWTRGGALRKVPVGGGTRKSASSNKRRRLAGPPTAAAATPRTSSSNNNVVVSCSSENDATAQSRYTDPVVTNTGPGSGSGYEHGIGVNLNEDAVAESGSVLSCWWSSTAGQMGSGGGLFPFVDGYGLGIGSGMGCEPDVLEWPLEQGVMGGGDTDAAVVSGESTPVCSTWQMGGGGGGSAEGGGGGAAEAGDYFSWPDLAISTPAAKDVK